MYAAAEEKAFPLQDLAHDIRAWAPNLIQTAGDDEEVQELAHTFGDVCHGSSAGAPQVRTSGFDNSPGQRQARVRLHP